MALYYNVTYNLRLSMNPSRKANRERQKRWREKQRSRGKKPLTVLLSEESRALLDREKHRTGETIAALVERAIQNLGAVETAPQEVSLKLDETLLGTATRTAETLQLTLKIPAASNRQISQAREKPKWEPLADVLLKDMIEGKKPL